MRSNSVNMRSNSVLILVLTLAASTLAIAQAPRQLAILEANGQMARSNPAIATAESRVTDELKGRWIERSVGARPVAAL